MATAKNKTQPTKLSPVAHLKTITDPQHRAAAEQLLNLFQDVTKVKGVMWGNIFGFGSYHYKYASGREGDFLATGFALRKSGPTIYIMPGYHDYDDLLKNLGPHKLGKSCLYLKNLNDIHLPTLKRLIRTGIKDLKKSHLVIMK